MFSELYAPSMLDSLLGPFTFLRLLFIAVQPRNEQTEETNSAHSLRIILLSLEGFPTCLFQAPEAVRGPLREAISNYPMFQLQVALSPRNHPILFAVSA